MRRRSNSLPKEFVLKEHSQSSSLINLAVKEHKNTTVDLNNILAPAFGNEEGLAAHLKELDEKLKVLVAISANLLMSIPNDQWTWNQIQSTFMNNPSARPLKRYPTVAESFEFKNWSFFQSKGDPDPTIIAKVRHWWNTAVPPEDIRKCTKIDIDEIANLVAKTGREWVSDSLLTSGPLREKTILDVGALRYPDMDTPYFIIYRLQIHVYAQYRGLLRRDRNGIRTELDSQRFEPRDEFIASLREEAKAKAIADMERKLLGS